MKISNHFVPQGMGQPEKHQEPREAARLFEASFLAEMLNHSGIARTPDTFGGGDGETQFSSLLVREYADQISRGGGIGLQEALMRAIIGGRDKDES